MSDDFIKGQEGVTEVWCKAQAREPALNVGQSVQINQMALNINGKGSRVSDLMMNQVN